MLSNDQRFPVSILHVLTEERPERASHVVPTADARGLIDFTSRTGEPKIVLVILVADQFFVEIADARKKALFPAAINHRVYAAFIAGLVRTRSAHRKGRM